MAWSQTQDLIIAGSDEVKFFLKKLDSVPAVTDSIEFDPATDYMFNLQNFSGLNATREVQTFSGYHYPNDFKKTGKITYDDSSFTINGNKNDMDEAESIFKNNDIIAVGIFDATENDKNIIVYSGQFSKWGFTIPNGDISTVTFDTAIQNKLAGGTIKATES